VIGRWERFGKTDNERCPGGLQRLDRGTVSAGETDTERRAAERERRDSVVTVAARELAALDLFKARAWIAHTRHN
jgi:hypothetical protein